MKNTARILGGDNPLKRLASKQLASKYARVKKTRKFLELETKLEKNEISRADFIKAIGELL